MVDFTSATHQFAIALSEGDLYSALGVPEDARRLDIDVAAARISDRAPQLAAQVTAVANVLTNRNRRATYQILRDLHYCVCQTVAYRCGEELLEAIPDYRPVIWEKCCELLRFDLDQSDIVVGPIGAASLARRGQEWVVESLLTSRFMVLRCTNKELREGVAARDVWYTECPVCHHRRQVACEWKRPLSSRYPGPTTKDRLLGFRFNRFRYNYHVPACPNCSAHGVDPSAYDATYTFRFASETPYGTVVCGEGRRSREVAHAIVDGVPNSSCSPKLLEEFYIAHQEGRDVTLAEIEDKWQTESSQGYAGEGSWHLPPNSSHLPADTTNSGTRILSWAGIALLVFVIRVGCEATIHLSKQKQHEKRWKQEFDSWKFPELQSPRIEPSYIREILEPNSNRTLRNTPPPIGQSISQDLSTPPDEGNSQSSSGPAMEISERVRDE